MTKAFSKLTQKKEGKKVSTNQGSREEKDWRMEAF
jgi:hypothetical protein